MIGDNGTPETPDWRVTPASTDVLRIARQNAIRWAETLDILQAAEDDERHVRGEN